MYEDEKRPEDEINEFSPDSGTQGWHEAITDLANNYEVPDELTPEHQGMNPLEEAIYTDMVSWQRNGRVPK